MGGEHQNKDIRLNISNLGCASCAVKMEIEIGKIPGVVAASIDFGASRLHLTSDGKRPESQLLADVDLAIHAIEKDACILKGVPLKPGIWQSLPKLKLVRFGFGLLPFLGALILPLDQPLRIALFVVSWLILGYDVLIAAFGNLRRRQLFDENFLMSIATLGALLIGEYPEAAAVMLFYQIGEILQQMAVDHSRRSIQALIDIRPDQAALLADDGTTTIVSPAEVIVGQRLLVRPGERVPLDAKVIDGQSSLDTAALTGESLPRSVEAGDEILAGCVNGSGLLTVEVIRPFADSALSRILEMVETASSRKAPAEQFITQFAAVYTPIMVGLAALIAIVPPLVLGQPLIDWLARALILLVISCPCALVLSVPVGYFAGLGSASSQGILVKGGNYLEKLAQVDTIAMDKTGTLTEGRFAVTRIVPAAGFDQAAVLEMAALAESYSSHPIADSILRAWREQGRDLPDTGPVKSYQDYAGLGLEVQTADRLILVGNERLMATNQVELPGQDRPAEETGDELTEDLGRHEGTTLYLAVNGEYAGEIWLSDLLKPEARRVVEHLRQSGVSHLALYSGDRWPAVRRIARQTGIEQAYAEMLPEDKVEALEALIASQGQRGSVVFVGDGINDAPVLARADVGIALGAGSDAAIESADIVIQADDLDKVATAIGIARRTRRIVRQNIALALGLKLIVLVLAVFGLAGIWQAVFADVGVAVLAVFNSLRVLIRR